VAERAGRAPLLSPADHLLRRRGQTAGHLGPQADDTGHLHAADSLWREIEHRAPSGKLAASGRRAADSDTRETRRHERAIQCRPATITPEAWRRPDSNTGNLGPIKSPLGRVCWRHTRAWARRGRASPLETHSSLSKESKSGHRGGIVELGKGAPLEEEEEGAPRVRGAKE